MAVGVRTTLRTGRVGSLYDHWLADGYGASYQLRQPHVYSFGREDDVNFQIADALVSRHHCEWRWDSDGRPLLVDLGSRNGTWINGERIAEPRPVSDGDLLRVGAQRFAYRALPRGADASAALERVLLDAQVTQQDVELAPSSGINGSLSAGGLLPLLEFFLATGRGGRLDLGLVSAVVGSIWFDGGAVVGAVTGELNGESALLELARLPAATPFTCTDGPVTVTPAQAIQGDGAALLVELVRSSSGSDLDRARDLQSRLLEHLPDLIGYPIAVHYAPHDKVGGDFYDIGELADGRLALVIGDVAGHGVQAALVVALVVKTLRVLRRTVRDPVDLILHLNDEIRGDLLPGQFLTIFVAALDLGSGALSVVLGGHHPAWILDADGSVQVIGETGMAVGIAASSLLRQTLRPISARIKPGQTLLQITDGLIEAMDANGDEYGSERLMAAAKASASGGVVDPNRMVESLAQSGAAFAANGIGDDLTILALHRAR